MSLQQNLKVMLYSSFRLTKHKKCSQSSVFKRQHKRFCSSSCTSKEVRVEETNNRKLNDKKTENKSTGEETHFGFKNVPKEQKEDLVGNVCYSYFPCLFVFLIKTGVSLCCREI